MGNDKVNMPASIGGLVRYFDEYKSKITFSPMVVVIIIALVILLEIYLHNWF